LHEGLRREEIEPQGTRSSQRGTKKEEEWFKRKKKDFVMVRNMGQIELKENPVFLFYSQGRAVQLPFIF
jgi:hypothetical protein